MKALKERWKSESKQMIPTAKDTKKSLAMSFEEVLKFNPYHDSLGRFASANGATSFTYAPGKSKAHDLAIARMKAKEMVNRLSEEDKDEIRNLLNGGDSGEDAQESQASGGAKENPNQKYSREEQVAAIEDWTLSDYQEIRAAQCGNAKGSAEYQEKLRQKGEAIEEYISSNPSYEGEIYRGIYMDNPATPKVGQKLDMQGTSSWSADEYVAQHFAGAAERKTFSEHAYVFKMQKAPSQSADIDDISRNHGELEVIVSKNVQFRVTGVEKTNTHTVITVVEEA